MKIQVLNEMANLSKEDTNLPYDIWMDSSGIDRAVKHNLPRLKVDIEGNKIPVSISNEPEVLVKNKSKDDIPKFRLLVKFIRNNLEVLLRHWRKEINDNTMKSSIKSI